MNDRHRRRRLCILLSALALLLALLPARLTYAVSITVDTTDDLLDAAANCAAVTVASLPGPDGVTSLREAMCAANNNPGRDEIHFDIIGGCAEPCTIQPVSPVPPLTDDATTIDGYSQPGTEEATAETPAVLKIMLDGSNAGAGSNGLSIQSSHNEIRGLVINRFARRGVIVSGSDVTGNAITGNYIGTDADGALELGNAWQGIEISGGAHSNTVGGATAAERNLISGNTGEGVSISGSGTMSNTVAGNYIGTDASGTAVLGNGQNGVLIISGAQNNAIGGLTAAERNVISSNGWNGVEIYGDDTTGNTISGNYIGLDASGALDMGNDGHGVSITTGAQNNVVGPANLIAHNDGDGVYVRGHTTSGNVITQNSIYHNNDAGIDLNDGANGGIAAPIITAAGQGPVNIAGTACTRCTLEIFANGDADAEGETYIGSTVASTRGVFTLTVSSSNAPYLTATATDVISGTSEFSAVFAFTARRLFLAVILR